MKLETIIANIHSLEVAKKDLEKSIETLKAKVLKQLELENATSQTFDIGGYKVVLSQAKTLSWSDIDKVLNQVDGLPVNPVKISYGVDKRKLDIVAEIKPELLNFVEMKHGKVSVKITSK